MRLVISQSQVLDEANTVVPQIEEPHKKNRSIPGLPPQHASDIRQCHAMASFVRAVPGRQQRTTTSHEVGHLSLVGYRYQSVTVVTFRSCPAAGVGLLPRTQPQAEFVQTHSIGHAQEHFFGHRLYFPAQLA